MASNMGPSNSLSMKYVIQAPSLTNSEPVSDVTTGNPKDRAASTVFASSTVVPTRQMRSGNALADAARTEEPLPPTVSLLVVVVLAVVLEMMAFVLFGDGDTVESAKPVKIWIYN